MSEIWSWVMIIGFVLGAGIVIYLFAAIPMMIYQKKEIKAFKLLANQLGFEVETGKVVWEMEQAERIGEHF